MIGIKQPAAPIPPSLTIFLSSVRLLQTEGFIGIFLLHTQRKAATRFLILVEVA
jgi:hypothetical protein